MKILYENKIELFDSFYAWLKEDGLKPYKSERLHKKAIFSNLINDEKLTLENFKDFIEYKKINDLIDKRIIYKQIDSIIINIEIKQNHYIILTKQDIIKVLKKDIDELIDKYIRDENG
ncbi:hypothetical protein CP965_03750 [Halarcobacter mediterraneus]|uniref:Uncharacterized protein n=1 Tax=Halarcobacter mediterraneus TaxID=2023153 RepID=A0A4Q1B2H0_9BACT|nr:hypothetical protein [Halarcobacter mediterraneus]RXK14571.1 hypothetical protein CP965_03750 [Halarcobacter mediterraneus]